MEEVEREIEEEPEKMTAGEMLEAELEEINRKVYEAEQFIGGLPALIAEMQEQINQVNYRVEEISENVYQVIKKPDSEYPEGDYLNPITYVVGKAVEAGKWYTDDEGYIWLAIKSGYPTGFDDKEYFDIVEV